MFICNTICQDYPGKSFQIQMGIIWDFFINRSLKRGTTRSDVSCLNTAAWVCVAHQASPAASCAPLRLLFCSLLALRPQTSVCLTRPSLRLRRLWSRQLQVFLMRNFHKGAIKT